MRKSTYLGWGLCLLWGFLSVSCVQKEYEVKDLDLTVNVGGDSLALPLGATDTIYARTLLDNAGDGVSSFLTILDDGTLAIRQDGGFGMDVPKVDVDQMTLPDFSGASVCKFEFKPIEGDLPVLPVKAGSSRAISLEAPVGDTVDIRTQLDRIPEEVERVDFLGLAPEAELVFSFEMPILAAHPDVSVEMDVEVFMPDWVKRSDGAGNMPLLLQGVLQKGRYEVRVPLAGLDLSMMPIAAGVLELASEFKYSGTLVLTVENPVDLLTWQDTEFELKMAYGIEHLRPSRFEGVLIPDLDPVVESVALDNIPDILSGEGTVFDFASPHLLVSVPTNLGLGLNNTLKITPFVGGNAQTPVQVTLDLPAREDARMDTTKYYVAGSMPADLPVGYTFVQADLAGLLKRIPDVLEIEVRMKVDEQAPCEYDFDATYSAGVQYDFVVPMSFGDELHLSLCDTLSALPDIINEILSKNVLRLGGEVQNSLPMDLMLSVVALDDNGEEVPMETASQLIKAGTPAGGAVSSPLALTLGDRTGVGDTRPVRALALQFTMTTGQGNAGVPVKDDSWVRAVLKAEIPGGITVDLEALGTNGKGEDPTPDEGIGSSEGQN